MAEGTPLPVVQAMVLCDHLYCDVATRKFVIAGTFNEILATQPPFVWQKAFLYVNLVDFSGDGEVVVRLVDLSDESVLVESEPLRFRNEDRLKAVEIPIALPIIVLPKPGAYAFEVLWGPMRTPLASWRLSGKIPPTAPGGGDGHGPDA